MGTEGAPQGWLDDYRAEGRGRNKGTGIIFVHGFTGSPVSMRPWAHYFEEQGFTVRVPRIPGHGTKWQDLNEVNWQEWPAKVEREIAPLIAWCDRIFIFGLSMGGANTLHVAASIASRVGGEKLAGIVLVNPMIHIPGLRIKFGPLIARLTKGLPSVGDDIKKPGVDEHGYDVLPTRGVLQLNKFLKATRPLLAKVKVPLLLFHSVDDHVLPVSNTEIIMAEVASSDKTRIELTNSYHVATLDYDAEIIFENSLKFVERISETV
jgi:carboxylesterase